MQVLNITLRTISQATEDEEIVEEALKFAGGVDGVEKENVKGHFGNRMVLMTASLRKKKAIRGFMDRLKEAGIISSLMSEIEERMDHDCAFHFRLDKQMAHGGVLALARTNDVIDCSVKVGAYPARREKAVTVLSETFQELLNV